MPNFLIIQNKGEEQVKSTTLIEEQLKSTTLIRDMTSFKKVDFLQDLSYMDLKDFSDTVLSQFVINVTFCNNCRIL